MVKGVGCVKKLEVEVEKGDFGATLICAATGWLLSVAYEGETIFNAAGDTREAVLKRFDDFIAELIELSRHIESVAKKMEDVVENFARE